MPFLPPSQQRQSTEGTIVPALAQSKEKKIVTAETNLLL